MPIYEIILLILLGIVVAICLFIILPSYFAGLYFYKSVIKRHTQSDKNIQKAMNNPIWAEYINEIKEATLKINALPHEIWHVMSNDGLKLEATFYPAPCETNKVALLVHGYTSNHYHDFGLVLDEYLKNGYHVLATTNRAHGASGGDIIGFGVMDRLDASVWVKHLDEYFNSDCTIVLAGVSMGASTVMMMSDMQVSPNIKGIIADCGFTSMYDEFVHQIKVGMHLPAWPSIKIFDKILKRRAKYGLHDASALVSVANTNIPMLFIHGDKDNFVPTWMSIKCYEACSSEKELWITKGAYHAFSMHLYNAEYRMRIRRFLASIEGDRL